MIIRLLYLLIFCPFLLAAQFYPQNYFKPPLTIPLLLSGSYGELRNNHFHSGFDIKTQGKEGLSVLASAEGEIVRVRVMANGYGNVLYMAHPNGYTTVYGHLQRFEPAIAAWVKEQQYINKKFEVDVVPPAGMFLFAQGDEIAKSGNSGGSGGPHLHFEIRDTKTEENINPALFGLPIKDSKKPTILHLYANPVSSAASVAGKNASKEIALTNLGHGFFSGTLSASGMVGLVLHAYDQQDAATNNNGIYKIQQFVNDTLTYEFIIDRVAFSDFRYLNAHIDFERYKKTGAMTHKCYLEPGNKLPSYNSVINRGLLDLKAGSTKQVDLIVWDSWGNKSEIRLAVKGEEYTAMQDATVTKMDWQSAHTIKIEGVKIYLPPATLYKDEDINVTTKPACTLCETSIYQVGERTIPAHARYVISIHKDQLKSTEKMVWAVVNSSGNGSGLTSVWDGDWLNASPKEFGTFAVMQDNNPPILTVNGFANGKIVKKGGRVSMTAKDYLSGITFYEATIDGNWVLLECDGKRSYYWHDFDSSLAPGSHTLILTFKDEVGNITTFQSNFTYQP